MPKKIVFCSDGTWDDVVKQTNVFRLYCALSRTADQVTFYDDGVGADGSLIERAVDGAFGIDLFQKVRDAYLQIAQVYRPGDPLYLFGFSRGAYTARSLAGMIAFCGLPTKEPIAGDDAMVNEAMVDAAFNAYHGRNLNLLAKLNGQWNLFDARITMVGVWDTVGALGIPAIFGGVGAPFRFLDTSLHPDIRNAFHAVAIDEHRREFIPTLWTSGPAPGQTIEQVWFAGAHCDLGGGADNPACDGTRLAEISLGWIASKAFALGLEFAPGAEKMYTLPLHTALALDPIDTSWKPAWGPPANRPIASGASISNGVAVRCAVDASYRPANLSISPEGVLSAEYTQVPIVSAPR